MHNLTRPRNDEELKGVSTVMAVLAVPLHDSPGFPHLRRTRPEIRLVFRLLWDSIPNRYIVLLKFRAEMGGFVLRSTTDEGSTPWRRRSAMWCTSKSVGFVSKAIPPHAIPPSIQYHEALLQTAGRGTRTDEPHSPQQHTSPTSATNLLELPTCPVCLERMDSTVTGLLMNRRRLAHHHSLNECNDCGATVNLWICLVCGNIGCGRYRQGHGYQHFADMNHLYSLELETQRVWDYARTEKKVEDSPMRDELRSDKVVVTAGGSSSSERRKGRK
ncbi:hypothetical protein BJ742DRAFT_778911 [Cladochytrium replicatum]|nr:hypothetical protein BJ742DRAFT_778911 [Cladochytrium replicatum]